MNFRPLVFGISALALLAACNNNGLVSSPVAVDICTNPTPTPTSFAPEMVHVPRPIADAYVPTHAPGVIASYAASASSLLQAMDADSSVVTSSNITGDPKQVAVFNSLGSLAPTKGTSFAFLSNGVAGATTGQSQDPTAFTTQPGTDFGHAGCFNGDGSTHDCVALSVTFTVPAGMHSIKFDFNFMSTEYPEFVNQGYNDMFTVKETSPSHNYDNISFDPNHNPIDIDSVFFQEPCQNLTGTGFDLGANIGFCDAGGTGLLTTEAPVEPGETVTLVFEIHDFGDGIYDSAVMLDNLQISPDPVTNPNTGGSVSVDCISPANGPALGGTEVRIHGSGFVNVQAVTFGSQAAQSFTVVNDHLIKATSPSTSYPGPVDVEVTASPSGTLIVGNASGAFTYDP